MSSLPKYDHAMAAAKMAQISQMNETAITEGGVSRISTAAGRNSRSSTCSDRLRTARAPGGVDGGGFAGAGGGAFGGTVIVIVSSQPATLVACMRQSLA